MRFLRRAINRSELRQLLELNGIQLKDLKKKSYNFRINVGTLWADKNSGYDLSSIAENEREKCGIILRILVSRPKEFFENPNNRGKFECRKTHIRRVNLFIINRDKLFHN
ncbi:hypothetical protein HOC80_03105 [archaeon]|jgi:hypothetical protein|nr:hypothetical protein [archaeon]MBT4417068.1 hypothetical protein [archaeon]